MPATRDLPPLPFLGGESLNFSAGGVINGTVNADGTIETEFAPPDDALPGVDIGPVEVSSSVSGGFLWEVDPDSGEWVLLEASASLGIEASAEAGFYVPIWTPPPVYCGVVVGVEAGLELEITMWQEELDPDYAFAAAVVPWVEGVVGVGVKGVGDLEGYIREGMYFEFLVPLDPGEACWPDAYLDRFGVFARAGVRAHWATFELFDVNQTWAINLGGGGKALLLRPMDERAHGGPRLMDRAHLEGPYNLFVANADAPSPLRSDDAPTRIVEMGFPRAVPSLAAADDDLLLAYVEDDETRPTINGTRVVFTKYVAGDTWTDVVAVDDDGTADYRPCIAAFANGDALLAWENIKEPLSQGDDLDVATSKTEIAAAEYDAESAAWGPRQTLLPDPDDAYFDHSPRLATAADGTQTAMVAWVREEVRPGELNLPCSLHYAVHDSTWLTAGEITTGLQHPVIDTALAYYNNGRAVLLFTVDTDDDEPANDYFFTTVADRELFGAEYDSGGWNDVIQLTNDVVEDSHPQAAYDTNGNLVIVWHRCQALYSAALAPGDPLSDLPQEARCVVDLRGAFAAGGEFRLAATPNGRIALVWQAVSPGWQEVGDPDEVPTGGSIVDHHQEGDQVDVDVGVWYALYDPDSEEWSRPLPLPADTRMERSMAPVFSASGQLIMAYNAYTPDAADPTGTDVHYGDPETIEIVSDDPDATITIADVCRPVFPATADLYVGWHTISGDLGVTVADIHLSSPNPLPGTDVTIHATIRNYGDVPAENIAVRFGDGEWIASPDDIPGPLVAGNHAEVAVVWPVPYTVDPREITVEITSADWPGGYEDTDPSNNSATITVLAPDLTITDITAQPAGTGQQDLTIRVANVGALPSPDATLTLHEDDPNGATLPDGDALAVPALLPGAYDDVQYRWLGAPAGRHLVCAVADESDTVAEFDETNNTRFVQVPDNSGACCLPAGTCVEDQTALQCSDLEGTWLGMGSDCGPPDPCPIIIDIEIMTDDYPSETTWQIIEYPSMAVVSSGGPYADPGTLYTEQLTLPRSGCYHFVIHDSYGDGICCGYGDGYYSVYWNGALACTGGEFGSEDGCLCLGSCPPDCFGTGACCIVGGCLEDQTALQCVEWVGTWLGLGSDCGPPDPCTTITGACCQSVGWCVEDQTALQCIEWGGTWLGVGSDCGPPDPCTTIIDIEIMTDDYPSETTWEIIAYPSLAVVDSGGPYAEPGTLYTEQATLPLGGCYHFVIYDSFGDGICCAYGDGYYNVYCNGALACDGGEFGSEEWCLCMGSCPHACFGDFEIGDVNCDGSVDFFDIDGFIEAIIDPAGYEAAYPDCDIMLADCNGDGSVDFFDIDSFIELVTGGG